MSRKVVLALVLTAAFLFSPLIVSNVAALGQGCDPSQPGIDLSNCLQLNSTNTVKEIYNTPSVLINQLVRVAFIAAGIILFFLLILAGFQFISGGPKGAEQAKSMFEAAIVGFVLMFAAYWIIQIIQLVTGTHLLI